MDHKLETHIDHLCRVVTADHDLLQINPKYRAQGPWVPAQRELQKINAYKTPVDKLECIVRVWKIILGLMSANPKDVGSDDFPILVFVILQVNPRALHTTSKYIEFYLDAKLKGETSIRSSVWNKFSTAVEFIKTLILRG